MATAQAQALSTDFVATCLKERPLLTYSIPE